MNSSIAERIKSLRLALGMTQQELADRVGLKKAAINKYETGRVVNIKRDNVVKLAETLNSTPEYILGYTNIVHSASCTHENDFEDITVSFSPENVSLKVNGKQGDFTEMFVCLSKDGKQLVLSEMLKYYCDIDIDI